MYIHPQKTFLQPHQGASKLQPNRPLIGLGWINTYTWYHGKLGDLLEFSMNHWFRFFTSIKIWDSSIPVLWKQIHRIKEPAIFDYFNFWKRTCDFHERTGEELMGYFTIFQFPEAWLDIKTKSLIFENRNYESQEPALITIGAQGGIPISNNCPTVVETSKKKLICF